MHTHHTHTPPTYIRTHIYTHTHTRTHTLYTTAAPSLPPTNFHTAVSTSCSITLRWDPPPLDAQNGVVTKYFLAYACVLQVGWKDCNMTLPQVLSARDKLEVTVCGLIPYTQYWFQISAETRAGKGPPTVPLICNTTQDGEFIL